MRCIETVKRLVFSELQNRINNNMRCIETKKRVGHMIADIDKQQHEMY